MSRSFFSVAKGLAGLLPTRIRESRLVNRLAVRLMEKTGNYDEIYSPRYYQTLVEPYVRTSAPQMAQSIFDTFRPASVIDVGCGSGALLAELHRQGVMRTVGLDASEAGLDMARARGLDVYPFNITTDHWEENERFDVAVSMETAEHLPPESALRYVELLCSLAPVVICTAAHPGQGGIGHLNEQPQDYWIARFSEQDMALDEQRVSNWQGVWRKAGVAGFYTNNLMIFRRS
ncbi:MAG: class I SAM-dependent methyltransferase [Kiritimatiellales bacterium]